MTIDKRSFDLSKYSNVRKKRPAIAPEQTTLFQVIYYKISSQNSTTKNESNENNSWLERILRHDSSQQGKQS